jgi:hypothetical protein
MGARINRGRKNNPVCLSMTRQEINGRISTGEPYEEQQHDRGKCNNNDRAVQRF